ncbi:hypothetical protein EYF80_047164 [Liparis tanakae]|uniref:Uncharacterized protein n=1 Tax=Liparis tanakae TaxID=230148 RepID=A0A4Z2FNA9_9TELE|nr:hypothetical protein EYF80_047164 [Liparis tanakae]
MSVLLMTLIPLTWWSSPPHLQHITPAVPLYKPFAHSCALPDWLVALAFNINPSTTVGRVSVEEIPPVWLAVSFVETVSDNKRPSCKRARRRPKPLF